MKLSPQQDRAARDIESWYRDPSRQVYFLGGYAGTGKTTCATHFAEAIAGDVLFAAFTGKAAHVMQRKGCIGATTIHRLIYKPKGSKKSDEATRLEEQLLQLTLLERTPDIENRILRIEKKLARVRADEQPSFALREEAKLSEAALLIVDECSMVGERIGRDLEKFGTKILVLGDPAQLPPVRGAGYWTNRKPDFLLTEIHRQAADSPVLHLATAVREGKRLQIGEYGDSRVVKRGGLSPQEGLVADQVLVGRNKTRIATNGRMRDLLGFSQQSPYPVVGDRLVCLRNNHDLGLLNGSIWTAEHTAQADEATISAVLAAEDGDQTVCCDLWLDCFEPGGSKRTWFESEGAEDFTYGYALTVHKSQGSQWDDVVVVDESSSFGASARQHLYTAITRAAEKVTVVL